MGLGLSAGFLVMKGGSCAGEDSLAWLGLAFK